MAIFKCAGCGFNLIAPVETCPNCDLKNPREPLRYEDQPILNVNIYVKGMIPVAIIALIAGAYFFGEEVVALVLIVGAILILLPVIFYTDRLNVLEQKKRRSTRSGFREQVALINRRVRELQQRLEQIDGVLGRIGENANESMVSVREKLKVGREVTSRQLRQYVAVGAEGELTRLQNGLLPLVFELDKLSYGQIEQGIINVDYTIESLSYVRDQLSASSELNEKLPTQTDASVRTEDTLSACQKLRESLDRTSGVSGPRGGWSVGT